MFPAKGIWTFTSTKSLFFNRVLSSLDDTFLYEPPAIEISSPVTVLDWQDASDTTNSKRMDSFLRFILILRFLEGASAEVTQIGRNERKYARGEEGKQARNNGSQIGGRSRKQRELLHVKTILERPDRDQAHRVREEQEPDRDHEQAAGDLDRLTVFAHAFDPICRTFQSECKGQEGNTKSK